MANNNMFKDGLTPEKVNTSLFILIIINYKISLLKPFEHIREHNLQDITII